jgi:hypothetical protein
MELNKVMEVLKDVTKFQYNEKLEVYQYRSEVLRVQDYEYLVDWAMCLDDGTCTEKLIELYHKTDSKRIVA